MPPDDLVEANELLTHPREVDLAVSQRLGFHVVARLATRHDISVSLNATPGSGITAVVILPAHLFTTADTGDAAPLARLLPASDGARTGGRVSGALPPSERERETVASPADAEPGRRSVPGLGVIRNGDAWLPPEPFAAMPGPDAGPAGPGGRWRG